mmetsp:Transcript_6717/g.10801  ORF Transcript_6717/g.10801 Transcript_6717/m.10801 type:complete len:186 (+) Transcript_6717:701-1258(+)
MDGQRREVNDFIIPKSQNANETATVNPIMGGGDSSTHSGRQFYIRYDIETGSYRIRDLGRGYGAFGKLQHAIEIRDSFLINIGESYVVSYLVENDEMSGADFGGSEQKLKLKIFPPCNLDKPDVITCQNDKQELIIGRSPNCDIRIDDQLISKMQSSIRYESRRWILEDGKDGKESTNGTWYYLN